MNKKKSLEFLKFYLDQGEITPETYRNAKKWLTRQEYADFKDEVLDLIRPVALNDAFYTLIPFGTGGRRGTTGVGTNRINARTIGESAQGLANHICKLDKKGELKKRGVVIACDVRPTSNEFSRITAEVMAAAGIKTYLFDGPRSTPELSFAIRHLKCAAGVVITASHNPPSDNGFKAYGEDGGQLVPPNDKLVLEQVKKVRTIKRMPLEKGLKKKIVVMIGKKVDDAYFKEYAKFNISKARKASIVFSPLHGTGVTTVPRALEEMGFKNVHMPAEQVEMNGQFPTVANHYPNPEIPAAMENAVKLAKEVKGDIVMASDPDADRLGVFVPDKTGDYVYLTGNQVGALLCHFVCDRLKATRSMPEKPFILTTLVSTRMARAIAESFGVDIVDDLLVGFKWMAQLLDQEEKAGRNLDDFIYAFEESIGFMRGSFIRDKDAASAAVTAAQLTAFCKQKKMTVLEYLDMLYEKYGYFKETQFSNFLRGEAGSVMMEKLMGTLRNDPPKKIGTAKVYAVIDRLTGKKTDMITGKETNVAGTKGNVLVFILDKAGKTSVTVRPSGTEPKIKHYISAFGQVNSNLAAVKKRVDSKIARLAKQTEALEEAILSGK